MRAVVTFGKYDDIMIDPEHVVSVRGVAQLDRAGYPIMGHNGRPRYLASMIELDTGNIIEVPEPPIQVHEKVFTEG